MDVGARMLRVHMRIPRAEREAPHHLCSVGGPPPMHRRSRHSALLCTPELYAEGACACACVCMHVCVREWARARKRACVRACARAARACVPP